MRYYKINKVNWMKIHILNPVQQSVQLIMRIGIIGRDVYPFPETKTISLPDLVIILV